ncbi:MAG: hypothetical protein AAF353_17245, partial [Pseudomonadota bacterium]
MNLEWLNWFGIDYLYSPDKRVFAGYLLFAILTGLFIGHLTRQPRSEWLSKDIWWHPSARLDYRYFVVISFIKLALIYPVIIGAGDVAAQVVLKLDEYAGYRPKLGAVGWGDILTYTALLFLANDISR